MTDQSPPPPSEPTGEPQPVSEPAAPSRPVSEPALSEAGAPRRSAAPATPAKESYTAWWIVIILAILATPPVVVMVMNLSSVDLPEATDEMQAVAKGPASAEHEGVIGRLDLAGRKKLVELIRKGKPCLNPLTIYRERRDRRKIDPYALDPATGQPMPDLHTEAWAVLTVPDPDRKDKDIAYHYRQNGHVAFLDGPDGDQVLIMPFTPHQFYVALVEHRLITPPIDEPDTQSAP